MAKKGTTKYKSIKQEKRVAKELDGRTVIGSGALLDKADVKSDSFLIECKTTAKNFYPLNLATWKKVQKEALKVCRTPLMYIDFNDDCVEKQSVIVMNGNDFEFFFKEHIEGFEEKIPAKKSIRLKYETGNIQEIIFEDDTFIVVIPKEIFEVLKGLVEWY